MNYYLYKITNKKNGKHYLTHYKIVPAASGIIMKDSYTVGPLSSKPKFLSVEDFGIKGDR